MEENVKAALEKQNPWWFKKEFYSGIQRLNYYPKLLKYVKTPEILLLVGARRTGKSTLLYQLIKELLRHEEKDSILFINLDEPLFNSRSGEPGFLNGLIANVCNEKKIKYVFIDEIQNYEFWANSLKILYDTQNLKIIMTGSSSALLQSLVSTRLSGRFLTAKIYPLSFKEYLEFNNISGLSTSERIYHFNKYIEFGGFPRVVLEKDEAIKLELLKNYFQTIYLKDIIYPHKLRNNKEVFELLFFVISNIAKYHSYSSISKALNLSVDTVQEYIRYCEESSLISTLMKYDVSVKKQIFNPKKIYCLDTGMVNAVSFKFSENKGRLYENFVYFNLEKYEEPLYYNKGKYECDFLIRQGNKITNAVQVSLSLKEPKTKKRELKGIIEAMKEHKLKEGLILTEEEKETIVIEGRKITVRPVYEWVLS